jgi:asparagine synthase (glutamine-hydrolysing)
VSKYLLKRHLEARVPASAIHRPKQGFDLPVSAWLRGPLRELARDVLLSSRSRHRGITDARRVETLWQRHQTGLHDHSAQLWAVLVLELWHRTFVDRDPRDGALR